MKKAANLGRSVIDAFPQAQASQAFSRLAEYFSESVLTARSTLASQKIPDVGVRLEI
jgi:flagellar biosynthesis protein FlhG